MSGKALFAKVIRLHTEEPRDRPPAGSSTRVDVYFLRTLPGNNDLFLQTCQLQVPTSSTFSCSTFHSFA